MNVICLEEEAFYQLIENVIERIQINQKEDKWISLNDAMKHLGIKSKTTMQKLRDEGKIRYTHSQPQIILYDKESIDDYLDRNAKDPF